MKKLLQILTAVIACVSLSGVVASAQASTCQITGTGPGSNNVCQFDNTNSVIYTCLNNVLVVNGTNQTSTTGIAQTTGNTSAGSATSGSAINEGETTTNASATCAAAAPATPTPTPSPTPAAPAVPQGGGTVSGVTTPAPAARVAALPNTGGATALTYAVGAVAGLGATAVVTQAVLASSRRRALRQL